MHDPRRAGPHRVGDHRRGWRRHERVPHRQAPRVKAAQCPGNDQSAGKRRSGKTGKGSRWLGIALTEAALAATHQKDTYLSAQYRRRRGRRGHKQALGAVKHSIIVAVWHMLTTGELYVDPGADYFDRRIDPQRKIKRLIAQLESLGQTVVVEPAAA